VKIMPLKQYGVIKGTVIRWRNATKWDSHYHILIDARGKLYRACVNTRSEAFPSELLYYAIDNFVHPLTDELKNLKHGYHRLKRRSDSGALDYIRDNVFEAAAMQIIHDSLPGPDNDLNELLDKFVQPMAEHPVKEYGKAPMLYAFGDGWGPRPDENDPIFGFHPHQGVHDIHMNQGNMSRWRRDDGIWQDGGLIFYYPDEDRWAALFLAFQTQSVHTNDENGQRLLPESTAEQPEPPALPGIPARTDKVPVRIVAALVNPIGVDFGRESITLKNMTSEPIKLDGWKLIDKNDRSQPLDGLELQGDEECTIVLDGMGVLLANRGGIITLLNASGIKIHGVAYTRQQASTEDHTIHFL
jgi:uncharacterized protein YukJ